MDIKSWIVNRLRRSRLNRMRRGIKVWYNQQAIIKSSKHSQYIFLNPIPPSSVAGGHVEHYYHFIFDLLLPLSLLIRKTSSKIIFVLEDFGVLTQLLLGLFENRVKICSAISPSIKKKEIDLVGMNPKIIPLQYFRFKSLKEEICANLNIGCAEKPTKILLIERLYPNSYYFSRAKNKGSGTSRRSIKNHKELQKFIDSKVKSPFEFHNVQLENMSLKDQINHFSSACVVIAQHGAGLSNILWMPEQSIVIELGYKSDINTYFRCLSKVMKHHYILFDYDEPHIQVNYLELHKKLLRNEAVKTYFKS
ncbi:MAG: glycosyltransferase family 61 protein [Bacteroidota bacterium]